MHRYKKRPVIVEAFQMTKERRQDNSEWPNWLHIAWQKENGEDGSVFPKDYSNSHGTDELLICTLEGIYLVSFNDWIIRGVNGELYPCKPDIFEQTYEKV